MSFGFRCTKMIFALFARMSFGISVRGMCVLSTRGDGTFENICSDTPSNMAVSLISLMRSADWLTSIDVTSHSQWVPETTSTRVKSQTIMHLGKLGKHNYKIQMPKRAGSIAASLVRVYAREYEASILYIECDVTTLKSFWPCVDTTRSVRLIGGYETSRVRDWWKIKWTFY